MQTPVRTTDYGACHSVNSYYNNGPPPIEINSHNPKALLERKLRPKSSFIKYRYLLAFLAFLGLFVDYSLRVNLSVALVAMVNNSAVAQNGSLVEECPITPDDNSTEARYEQYGEFDWDENTQGIILGAFFYGYVATQLPGGLLAEKYGAKWLFGGGIMVTSLLSLITPLAASYHLYAFIVVRVLQGLAEGVTIPAWCAMISRWALREERSTLFALANSGTHMGTILTLPVAAMLCETDFAGYSSGWPLVFYVFGGFGCLWFAFWCLLTTSSPEEHKWISEDELSNIIMNRPATGKVQSTIPWKCIFTSVPVLALSICRFCACWGFYTLLTDLPTYMNMSLHVSISKNGFLNSLLYIAEFLSVISSGFASDVLRVKGYIKSTTITRKAFEVFALTGPAICLALVPQAGCNHLVVLCLLVTAAATHGLTAGGDGPNPIDIAPDFSGTVGGLVNAIGNTAGIFAPLVAGRITLHNNNMETWSKVFYLSSIIYVFGAIVFLFFGSGNVQPWGVNAQSYTHLPSYTPQKEDSENMCGEGKLTSAATKSQ